MNAAKKENLEALLKEACEELAELDRKKAELVELIRKNSPVPQYTYYIYPTYPSTDTVLSTNATAADTTGNILLTTNASQSK